VAGAEDQATPAAHLANIESADAVTALLVEHLEG
jgi:hypothetical protein